MTRTKKLELIKIYRPCLYMTLIRYVPQLVINPEYASLEDIQIYNHYVGQEALRDTNKTAFKNRFSF